MKSSETESGGVQKAVVPSAAFICPECGVRLSRVRRSFAPSTAFICLRYGEEGYKWRSRRSHFFQRLATARAISLKLP